MPLRNISDTARWVAYYRAIESERPDRLFDDPFARRLAGDDADELIRSIPKARSFAWPMIVRTAVMDEILQREIDATPAVDLVLNLAAGLDTRPYRLELPRSLRWVEVDLPDILDYKVERLGAEPPACELERIALDLADREGRRALFARLGAAARRVLVVSEGLLVYLSREDVATLAGDLHEPPSFALWLLDLASPQLLVRMRKMWGPTLAAASAPFRFAPEEGTAFFAPRGWREREFRSTFEESVRLHRTMRFAFFFRLLGRLASPARREQYRRFSGIVLLERSAERG